MNALRRCLAMLALFAVAAAANQFVTASPAQAFPKATYYHGNDMGVVQHYATYDSRILWDPDGSGYRAGTITFQEYYSDGNYPAQYIEFVFVCENRKGCNGPYYNGDWS
ncbi:hypothetical protein [Micromonospora sp. NPDC049679]|uniref:hypothetical protein n=1 Tax=Micromonospora sp. NPDC049679 TaxID=3155920 RepID=UPI0033D93D0F